MAFKNMPETFISIHLTTLARSLMARPMCMDGTILRRLRELREEQPGDFNYRVINNDQGLYKKSIKQ